MEYLWLRATSVRKLVNWTRIGKLEARKNHFDETRIRCYVSRATTILFKDSTCGSGRGPENSPCPSKDDPREAKTSNQSKDIYCSTKKSKKPDGISEKNSCDSERPESSIISEKTSAELDDPCQRDCKLSSNWPSDYSSGKKIPPSNQPPVCPPTEDFDRNMRFWKRLSLLGALPVVLIASIVINAKKNEEAREPRPKFVPMDYMYRRTKRYPWGDGNHTLFHNPVRNAVPPHGYEVEDPNEVKKLDR